MIFCSSLIVNSTVFELLGCFFLSLFLSFLLYRKHSSLQDVSKLVRGGLFVLRFCVFFLLFFLLFNPQLRKAEKIEEHPIIVFMQDNSSSVKLNSDSSYYENTYLFFLDSLFKNKKLDVDVFSFDQSITKGFSDFSGDFTNLSNVLDYVSDLYSNQNIGAYILASDGIYNKGLNPLYLKKNYNAPLYTVLLGDTTIRKDLSIVSVKTNKLSYLGNSFPVQLNIKAHQMNGANLNIKVFDNTDSLFNNPIFIKKSSIDKIHYHENVEFFISPDSPGLQSYSVHLETDSYETNLINNHDVFHIDIIDDRQKILILYSHHHPDVTALKHSLESYDQYQVDTEWVEKNKTSMNNYQDYSLIILHQVSDFSQIDDVSLHDVPVWYIMGKNSNLSQLNQIQNTVYFNDANHVFEFSDFVLNDNFSTFVLSDSLKDFLSLSSSLLVPFLAPELNNLTDVLLYKKIGSLDTNQPILFFSKSKQKEAYLLGEGLWRLKLNDTYLNNNNLLFNTFISKIVQSLLSDDKKKRLHIHYNSIQSSNARIVFEGELYNKNFELINYPELNLVINDSVDQVYNYQLNRLSNTYYLDIVLPLGRYDFLATSELNNEIFTDEGSFVVVNPNFEAKNTIANYELLHNLASSHNGYVTTMDSLDHLLKRIKDSSSFKVSSYFNYSFKSLINFQSILILVLFLLFIEWLIRRRYINF